MTKLTVAALLLLVFAPIHTIAAQPEDDHTVLCLDRADGIPKCKSPFNIIF